MEHTYILIMAGGEGTRFAPFSTPERPKQFLSFIGDETFIQQTRRRIASLVPVERIFIATNERYVSLVREQLPDIPKNNIIAEPCKKNTAPCIAYAARLISERDANAVMAVLPSDHVILRPDRFREAISLAVKVAKSTGKLVTIGITPSWPATGYGYIKRQPPFILSPSTALRTSLSKEESLTHPVHSFTEKPDESTAQRYIEEGGYYWNSGMFIWRVSSILSEVANYLPQVGKHLKAFDAGDAYRKKFFASAESISIDYGVMEKSTSVAVIPCDIGWSDVGTWESLDRLSQEEKVIINDSALQIMQQILGESPLP